MNFYYQSNDRTENEMNVSPGQSITTNSVTESENQPLITAFPNQQQQLERQKVGTGRN